MPSLEDFGITNCGIDVKITKQRDEILKQAQVFLDLKGQIGKPEIIGQVEAAVGDAVESVKDQVEGLIPPIPPVVEELKGNLGDALGGIAALVAEGKSVVEELATTAADFVGLSNINGAINLDLNDLTNSALSLGGSFDPCAAMSSIGGNVTKSGQSMPAIQPKLGDTLKALPISIPNQKFTDSFTRTNFTVRKSIAGVQSRLSARL